MASTMAEKASKKWAKNNGTMKTSQERENATANIEFEMPEATGKTDRVSETGGDTRSSSMMDGYMI